MLDYEPLGADEASDVCGTVSTGGWARATAMFGLAQKEKGGCLRRRVVRPSGLAQRVTPPRGRGDRRLGVSFAAVQRSGVKSSANGNPAIPDARSENRRAGEKTKLARP